MEGQLHPNHEFMLAFAERADGTVLDYGCGAGEVVAAGRQRGIDIIGAEVFYSGGSTREKAASAGLLGTTIHEIVDGRLPFADREFALIVNNQVFEHVADLEDALSEIDRVLKPGGQVLSLFPSRDVWREGHIGIPFAHRFDPGSRWRYPYTLMLRRLGLGANKGSKPTGVWASDSLRWLDRYCYYRDLAEIRQAFARRFSIAFREDEYLEFRLRATRLRHAASLVRRLAIGRLVVRKLAGLVVLGTKPA